MNCPNCGRRPISFSRWLRTLRPFRLECVHCHSTLQATNIAYVWTALHAVLGAAMAEVRRNVPFLRANFGLWLLLVVAVLFCTAFVIPYFAFRGGYRVAPTQ